MNYQGDMYMGKDGARYKVTKIIKLVNSLEMLHFCKFKAGIQNTTPSLGNTSKHPITGDKETFLGTQPSFCDEPLVDLHDKVHNLVLVMNLLLICMIRLKVAAWITLGLKMLIFSSLLGFCQGFFYLESAPRWWTNSCIYGWGGKLLWDLTYFGN